MNTDAPSEPGAPRGPKRLATIVAIDAAGYSRQSEIDEAVAIREISALGERIRAAAATAGGRVFNTAGDGFMLEFSAASGAVAAAEEIVANNRVPVRIGVHLGEVTQTPENDLLGRGVNIAARLQSAAKPGEVLLSGDVQRALPAEIAARLAPRGSVQLNKMRERIDVFTLGAAWKGARRLDWRSPKLRWGAVAAVAALLAVLALVFAPGMFAPRVERVAVMQFETPGAEALAPLANGVASRIVSAISQSELQTVPPAQAAAFRQSGVEALSGMGVSFVVDGAIRTSGDMVAASAQIIDAREGVSLWSAAYERPAAEAEYLPEQIAADLGHVLQCALVSRRPRAGEIDTQTLSLFLRACDRSGKVDEAFNEFLQVARQVTERAPRFSRGWSMRAIAAAPFATFGAPEERAVFAEETRSAAARARALDRRNGESYLAESMLQPSMRTWRERQSLIDQALEAEPDLAAAHAAQSSLYLETGRLFDAAAALRRAVAIEPLSQYYWISLTPVLAAAGQRAETDQLRARYFRVWPNSPMGWMNRFFNSAYLADPREALGMLDDMDRAPVRFEAPARARWRAFLEARAAGDSAAIRRAALNMRQLIEMRLANRMSVAAVLATAGEIDAAMEVIEGYLAFPDVSTSSIFMGPFEALRRDRRFMALVKDTGLIEYWRETGRWPDFCPAPGHTYDCAAEAARVLGEAG